MAGPCNEKVGKHESLFPLAQQIGLKSDGLPKVDPEIETAV